MKQNRSERDAGVSFYEYAAYAAGLAAAALAAKALLASDDFALKSAGLVIGLIDILAGMFVAAIVLIDLSSRLNIGSFRSRG